MAAGLVYKALGHDRIAGFAGIGRALPVTVLTFALAGLALMGLPPSGAFAAKKLLLDAAGASGQWWWEVVLQGGGFLTASYVVLVLAHVTRRGDAAAAPVRVPRSQEIAALALALCSFALALAAVYGPVPGELLGNPLAPKELIATLVTVAGGCVVALLFARDIPPLIPAGNPIRAAMLAVGGALERTDTALRQWAVAGLSLLVLAFLFGAAMRAHAA